MELLEAIRRATDPEVKRKLLDAYKRRQARSRAREAEVHHWIMLLTARTGYPTGDADLDRAAAAFVVMCEGVDKEVRDEALRLASRHMDWNRWWVDGIRKRVEGKGVEAVPDPIVPF